jgi:hypothetical protein
MIDTVLEETARRFEAALRGARLVGHKRQSEMKLGKPKGKPKKSPGHQKRKGPPGGVPSEFSCFAQAVR